MATKECMENEKESDAKSPRIWGRFQGLRPLPSGQVPEFWITDLTEEWEEKVLQHLVEHFLHDAPLMRALRMFAQPDAVREVLPIWRNMMGFRTSLIVLTDGEDGKPVLAACNLLAAKDQNNSEQLKVQNESLRIILEAMRYMEDSGADGLAQLNPEGGPIMTARGLAVAPAYRGQGIGLHLLRARVPLCRALGLRVTATVFVGAAAQKLAARAGFQTLAEVPFKEYRDSEGRAPFLHADGSSSFMALRVLPLPDSSD